MKHQNLETECRYCLGPEHPCGTMCVLHPDFIPPECITITIGHFRKLCELAANANSKTRSLNQTISDLIAYRFALQRATRELLVVAEEMPAYSYDERGHEAYMRKVAAVKLVKEILNNTATK